MIWYLLYFFRGTTDPPTLGVSHPLRRAFTRYGREAARHPVITLLISVALAAILIYPFPFLYTNTFTNGISNLPHHVWTAAQPYEGSVDTHPDVVMRSLWVHGSYMKALEQDVLQTALKVQDELLGSTVDFDPAKSRGIKYANGTLPVQLTTRLRDSFHASNGLSNQSWFFHSPLLYWSGSGAAISADADIITTVNQYSHKATKVNVTLRHSVVFSGKRFEDNRLIGADALVITLIHKLDSPVGRYWERKAEDLAFKRDDGYKIFPSDGRARSSKLYEFKFQPLSLQDDIMLGIAYTLTTLYFFLSLTRLRAVKSRVGLTVTVIAQIGVSIMSSFTVCAVLKIDLSKIPREAYPLVVLTIGLENMFRLINAVITTPTGSSMTVRIAEALGQTGHVALAGVAQNLIILWMLYKIVSPGVGAFCIFAALALIFDFLYLLTFFVSVLSVDVRRTELSDSLYRADVRRAENPTVVQKVTWADALLRGETPISTRLAGTVVMIGFVILAQWHFFDQEDSIQTFYRLIRLARSAPEPEPTAFENLNQARTPVAWLKLQDHETAREVIQVIKPHAHSYIAQVYEPLVIVLDGSDRTPTSKGIRPFLPAAYDFLRHQSMPFVATVLLAVAAVSLLMNYLLWNEEQQNMDDDDNYHPDDEPLLAAKALDLGHALDIALLVSSPTGIVASVGLDRFILVCDLKSSTTGYRLDSVYGPEGLFPILSLCIDDLGHWLAIASASGKISLWDIKSHRWGPVIYRQGQIRKPISLFFKLNKTACIPPLIWVHHSGSMTQMLFSEDGEMNVSEIHICKSLLVCSHHFWDRAPGVTSPPLLNMVTASRRGCVHYVSQSGDGWLTEGIENIWPSGNANVACVLPLPSLRCFLTIRDDAVDLVNLEDHTILYTFITKGMVPSSLHCFHSTPSGPSSTLITLKSFSLIYTERETKGCKLMTYLPSTKHTAISVNSNHLALDSSCNWDQTVVDIRKMTHPGNWETLPIGVVIGVRKSISCNTPIGDRLGTQSLLRPSLLRRRNSPQVSRERSQDSFDSWEAWTLSTTGEILTIPLSEDKQMGNFRQHLLATTCGPLIRVGQRSIAVGIGNMVKIITVGLERYDGGVEMVEDLAAVAGRRRRPLGAKRACSARTASR